MERRSAFFAEMDIDNLIERKSLHRLRRLQDLLEVIAPPTIVPQKREEWEPYLKEIFIREILINLRSDVKKYIKIYPRSNYKSDIDEAKTNNRKLFRIIGWDKAWLGEEWVQRKIGSSANRVGRN